jgi:hypothetical protein
MISTMRSRLELQALDAREAMATKVLVLSAP